MSGDGSYVIFQSEGIYSVHTDGTRLYRIPDGPSAPDYFEVEDSPHISPDGMRVAYSTFRYSNGLVWDKVHNWEIATARVDGTDAKRLTSNDYRDLAPVWSPDGSRIAFVTRREGSTPEIYTISSDGSDERRIATGGHESTSHPILVWSPDGQCIAFRDFDRGWREGRFQPVGYFIATVGWDGSGCSGFRRIFESESGVGEPIWSPDGRRIAFLATDENSSTAIYSIDVDGSNARQAFTFADWPENISEAMGVSGTRMWWSPDGSEIRFLWYAPNFGLHSVRPDGTGFHTLIEELPWSIGLSVELSPDHSRIIVYQRPQGNDVDIALYTMALDGSDRRILARYAYGDIVAENSHWRDNVPTCSTGEAVTDPGNNEGLVQDCETLLRIRDTLVGEAPSRSSNTVLNWRPYRSIESWTGIMVGGSPPRVTVMILEDLGGEIPPELGELTELERLVLSGQLTGSIPPELGNLVNLEDLILAENKLTGSIPLELANLQSLELLAIHKNHFTGCFPKACEAHGSGN